MKTREKGISGAESEMREKPTGIRSPVKVLSPFPIDTGGEKERTSVGAVFCGKRDGQAGTGKASKYRKGALEHC